MKAIQKIAFIAITFAISSCDNPNKKLIAIDKLEAANEEVDGKIDKEFQSDYEQDTIATQTKTKGTKPAMVNLDPDWDKKIIKNAILNIEVKDYNSFYSSLREKIRNFGGYVAQEEQSQSEYKIENSIIIKVPVDQFDNAITIIANPTEKINEKKISSQDVTAEFIDTRSRIESKRQVRQRYLDLLKQAKNMEEILNVQNVINGVQEEIESASGRVKYLGHAAVFSTINLTFYQVMNPSAKNADNPAFVTKLRKAFLEGGSWIVDLIIGLVTIWPLLLVVMAGILFYRKTRTRVS